MEIVKNHGDEGKPGQAGEGDKGGLNGEIAQWSYIDQKFLQKFRQALKPSEKQKAIEDIVQSLVKQGFKFFVVGDFFVSIFEPNNEMTAYENLKQTQPTNFIILGAMVGVQAVIGWFSAKVNSKWMTKDPSYLKPDPLNAMTGETPEEVNDIEIKSPQIISQLNPTDLQTITKQQIEIRCLFEKARLN